MQNAQKIWSDLLNTTRFYIDDNKQIQIVARELLDEDQKIIRSDYDVDIDRVTFSSSFRRLGRKTQVHPFAEQDEVHNRLTHSVEVARVGRSLGTQVGVLLKKAGELHENILPEHLGDVVQVACLAHDLGNPPFGHTGEDAIRYWFSKEENQIYLEKLSSEEKTDIQTYEGNAHTLRIVQSLEMYQHKGGMRLTAASLGTLMKYPWVSSVELKPNQPITKFCIYQSELPFVERFMKLLNLPSTHQDKNGHPIAWVRHPLSYLMEAADDICYALLDLEDAVTMGLINEHQMQEIINNLCSKDLTQSLNFKDSKIEEKCARMRGQAIGHAVNAVAHLFFEHRESLIQGNFPYKDLLNAKNDKQSEINDVCSSIIKAKDFARENIYDTDIKLKIGIAAFPCIGRILSLFIPMAYRAVTQGKENLQYQDKLALKFIENKINVEGSLYEAYMSILDYICSLTDDSAAKLAREVSGISMVQRNY